MQNKWVLITEESAILVSSWDGFEFRAKDEPKYFE